ncbi:protein cordon-bleu isoform X3 [Channa argus]
MKARAPPPPQPPQPAPRHIFRNTLPDGGGTSGVDGKENMLRRTVDLQLTLPQGYQTFLTEDGSKALMDLLVELCSRYHLNPALHTLELLTPEGNPLGFKPNALLGSLNVACVLIKEKLWEEKGVHKPAPKVPEKTVRLMVNYHGSQKAVVRVNPLIPLQALIPAICDKCEFDPAHILLLKNNTSHHELPLDKSLTELGIKELYIHNQSLVHQLKMASAPALNLSGSIHSSSTTSGRAEKKGLLSVFQFSRRKYKTETTSMDMGDCDDNVIQNANTQSNSLSSVSGFPGTEDQPRNSGHSQSVMSTPRMSPKAETKKRRAPAPPGAPTPILGQTSLEGYQMGHGLETQQRKRKAPAPPTPASITPGSDDTLTSGAPTPESYDTKTQTPAFHSKVAQSIPISSTLEGTETINQLPLKIAVEPSSVCIAIPNACSRTPRSNSSSTTNSLAVQDSSSEISRSLDDSDADLDQAVSHCSILTSSTVSDFVQAQPTVKSSSSRTGELAKSSSMAATFDQEAAAAISFTSETELALDLKVDEVENNRHSTMGTTDQPARHKPHCSPAQEPPQLVQPPTLIIPLQSSPLIQPTEHNSPQSAMELKEAAPQSWLHSMQSSKVSDQKSETETPEEETQSLGSNSSSLHDQGYAASEGMVEGEDSGMVSSPSETQPTSPDGSLTLDGSSGFRGERLLGPVRDNSSDSDEGCATWGSRHRKNDISSQVQSDRLKNTYKDDKVLTTQLHETLAGFEADLADRINIASLKETSYTMFTDTNEIPVSVVDMDVPVTAIDEVLENYEHNSSENEAKSLTRNESAGNKGPGIFHQPSMERNKNNNAYTAADRKKSTSVNTKQTSQPKQYKKLPENKAIDNKNEENTKETKFEVKSITDSVSVKEDKQRTTSAVKFNNGMHKQSRSTEVRPDCVKSNTQTCRQMECVTPPTHQRSVSTESGEEIHRVFQNHSSSYISHGKITCNVTSRFGMKTFTVVPPKPSVMQAATEEQAVTINQGAIKIDDQGNMVKADNFCNKVSGSSESGTDCSDESPLLGKAKAFWCLNEKQEKALPVDRAKENMDGLKSTPIATSGTTFKTKNTEYVRTTQSTLHKLTERDQPKEMLNKKAPVKDIQVTKEQQEEVHSLFSVSKDVQLPSNEPAVVPLPFADLKRDMSFLKPSRRTSSQYVASAITKYTPKSSVKPSSISNVAESSASVKTHSFQKSGRSIQVIPHQYSPSFLSDNKETDSASNPNPSGAKRSMSYPEYMSKSQTNVEEVTLNRGGSGSCVASTKVSSDFLETETAKNKQLQSSDPIQINVTTNNDKNNIKHIRPRSPITAESRLLHSYDKPSMSLKTLPQDETYDIRNNSHLTPVVKPLPSVMVSDSGVTPVPPTVTVFGQVKKFRPVNSVPVEKETSLHSRLMEAIQTGGGKDRLKTISTSGPSNMKKPSNAEEENERSALLAAIRAQSNSGRLRKTESEAAVELEKFRKAGSEENRCAHPLLSLTPPTLPPPAPPVFTPPPPPLPPLMVASTPLPPVLPKGKPSTLVHPSANNPMNPALAREAMLEAIRSGSAAERLKKVGAPTKTVQVNGRLGTVKATSPTLPEQ